MSLDLTIIDRASTPTGAGFFVSGTSGGAWSILSTPVDRPWPEDDWATIATGTGDGTADLDIDKRLYFFYLTSGGACTPPRIQAITDGLDSLATRARAATVAVFKLLNLPDIGDKVHDQQYPDKSETLFPCVVVHIMNQAEIQQPGTNVVDTVGYGLNCQVFDNHQMTDQSRVVQFELWRQMLARAFRNMHLPGVPESIQSTVEYGNVSPMQDSFVYEFYVGSLIIRNFVRDTRGMGA